MSAIKTMFLLLMNNPCEILSVLFWKISKRGLLNFISDKTYIKWAYRNVFHRKLNLSSPKAFSEKIQWLKLYDRNPLYKRLVDKYEVKKYVYNCIGGDYIIPNLGIWNNVEEINWDLLPNTFVLKTTNGSGGYDVILCKDKNTFNKDVAINKIKKSFNDHAFWYGREWPYKDLCPRILAEAFVSDESYPEGIPDYKFYCFHGVPKYCQVIRDRSTQETIDFYDMDWNHMPFIGFNSNCKNGVIAVPCPRKFDDMKSVCYKLAKDIPFVRIDLYEANGKVYFGEMTFYPSSGYGMITPPEWDFRLGELLKI